MGTSRARSAAIYLDRGFGDADLDEQRRDGLVLAERFGWHVVQTYVEPDIEIRRDIRPAFGSLMEGLAEVEFSAVIALDLSLLMQPYRTVHIPHQVSVERLQTDFMEMGREVGLMVAFIRGGLLDLRTPPVG